jgi:hypothetical protein
MAFACENISAEPGNPISVHNILDGVEAPDFPAPTGRWLGIFCFFSKEEGAITNCRVSVTHEGGEVIAQTRVRDLVFDEQRPISRNVVNFEGLTWPYPGWYTIKFVAERERELAKFPILVQQGTPSPEEEAEDAAE